MQPFRSPNKQAGTAILMSLLVVALVMTFSTLWFLKTEASIRRTQQMLISDQMFLSANWGVLWGKSVLETGNIFPVSLPPAPIDNGILSGYIDKYPTATETGQPGEVRQKYAMVPEQGTGFLLKTILLQDRQQLILYTLFSRNKIAGKYHAVILWQSRGLA